LGKTREEVFLGLDIKKAELMSTGEVRLGNGKIMGHRKYNNIYKQKPRLPDERDSILINKIAVEYRKLRAIQRGDIKVGTQLAVGKGCYPGALNKKEFKDNIRERKVYEKTRLKHAM